MELVKDIKVFIENNDLLSIKEFYENLIVNTPDNINWSFVYQKVYLHACLKKKHTIVEYLKTLFDSLPVMDQITIRQMFHYGDYLLNRD